MTGMGTLRSIALPKHMPGLDGLRGIAVVLVVLCHLFTQRLPGGAVGVDVFFVLSGFLITGILIRELDNSGRIGLRRFYGRRLIRLYPPMLAVLLIAFVPGVLLIGDEHVRATVSAMLYITPFAQDLGWISQYALAHTWSLTVEELFYLVWPFVLMAIVARRSLRESGWWTIAVGVSMLLMNVVLEAAGVDELWLLRAGGMLIGCGAAFHASQGCYAPTWTAAPGAAGIAAGVALWGMLNVPSIAVLSASIGTAAVVSAIAGHSESTAARALSWKPLRWLGTISYELYLVHWPIIVLSNAALVGLEVRRLLWVATCVLASVALAAGLHYALAPLQRAMRARLDALVTSPPAGATQLR